ncbi:hypothetical protein LSAT2_000745 [Lamellibrachia satsuma]|nr:hypothetical protein LSAT2_000745 [Lamellibrachia satsuma]
MSEEPSSFSLTGADTGFSSRSQDVFSSLATIEAKHDAFQKATATTASRKSDGETLIKDDPIVEDALPQKRSTAFKRPRGVPPPRKRWTPDYRQHPERWVKYDLSDVQADQMSERSNTAAAMDFLNTQRRRKDENIGVDDAGRATIQFKKPTVKVSCQTAGLKRCAATNDTSFGNSKVVMPEHVVGQSASKKRQTKRLVGQVKCDAVGLCHLGHSDEEVEEEEGDTPGKEDPTEDAHVHRDAPPSCSSGSPAERCQHADDHCAQPTLETDGGGVVITEDVPSTDSVTKQGTHVAFKKSSKSRARQRRARREDDTEEDDN